MASPPHRGCQFGCQIQQERLLQWATMTTSESYTGSGRIFKVLSVSTITRIKLLNPLAKTMLCLLTFNVLLHFRSPTWKVGVLFVSEMPMLAWKQRKAQQPLQPEEHLTYYSCHYGSNEIKCACKWLQCLCCDIYYVGTTSQAVH